MSGRVSVPVVLAPGAVVDGKYRIEQLLGEGGMGSVFRATHLTMRRQVAIKIMRPEVASDPAMAARFEREALASSRIRSPNVVLTYDFGHVTDGPLYLVMELLDGESLAARLDREPLTPPEVVRVAAGIARGLVAAHEAGVVHRDLKPDNIFLCRDGTVKVVDFGIARVLEGDTHEVGNLTVAGSFVGTPHYMSPEACGTGAAGPAADLYSFGVLLFEALTGSVPFHDDQLVLLMGLHVRVPPELVREARPDLAIPDALEELVDQLLAKAPDERPSALETLHRLEALDWSASRVANAPNEIAPLAEAPTVIVPPASGPHAAFHGTPLPVADARPAVATFAEPAPAERSSGASSSATRWVVAAALLALALVGSISVVAMVSISEDVSSSPPPLAPSPPITTPPPLGVAPPATATAPIVPPSTVAPRTVRFRFERSPRHARIVEGDLEVGDELEVTADGSAHRFVVTAPGFVAREISAVADQDRVLRATLRRRGRRGDEPQSSEELLTF